MSSSSTSAPAHRAHALPRLALGLVLLTLGALFFANVDLVLAWDDSNEFLGRGRLLLYFTAQSNLLAAASFAVFGVQLLRGAILPGWAQWLRGLATVDMAITGVVFGLTLADPAAPWTYSEFLLHQGGPLLVVIWWILMPPAQPLPWVTAVTWLVHPLVWTLCVFTYASESSDHWVPYFFLDPAEVGGMGGVVAFVVVVHVAILVLGLLAVWTSRARWRARAWSAMRLPS